MPAYIVTGLGFGDEGKGLVTDYLARQHKASGVVITNGGAQRAHNVVLPDGTHHTFSQIGSGHFTGVPTHLSKHALVNPHALFVEWDKLDGPYWPQPGTILVDEDALITTPFHVAANRIREHARGQNQHGTCGMGIGETVMAAQNGFKLQAWELKDPKALKPKLEELTHHLRLSLIEEVQKLPERWNDKEYQKLVNPVRIQEALEIYRIFVKAVPQYDHLDMDEDDTWIFEGGQGVLLDEFHGFHPHTTWSKTTPANALSILHESGLKGYKGEVTKIGVMRSYMTRHGAGPFPTEDPSLHERFPEAHNDSEGLQGAWRVGWTDLRAMRYALDATGSMDQLAVTHLDRVGGDWKICTNYDKPLGVPWSTDREKWLQDRAWALEQISTATPQYAELPIMSPDALTEVIENELGVPVGITSYGPSYCDVKERVLA